MELSLNAEGANGPVDQREDFKDAKETCKRLDHEHTAFTGCGNTPIPPQQQVRRRPNQQFVSHEEYSKRLDSSGWKCCVPATIHSSYLRHHGDNRAIAGGQCGIGTPHHGVNSDFFSSFQMRHFACRKFNLLGIDRGIGVISTLTAHTFFSCALCQRACPSLLSQLFSRLQSSRHALTSRTRVAQGSSTT